MDYKVKDINPKMVHIPIDALRQSLKDGKEKGKGKTFFTALVENIKENGVILPIIVIPYTLPTGVEASVNPYDYTVVDGVQRVTASIEAGLTVIPALIAKDMGMAQSMILNLLRAPNTEAELSEGIRKLLQGGTSVTDICRILSISLTTFDRWAKVKDLPPELRQRVYDGKIPLTTVDAVMRRRGLNQSEKVDFLSDLSDDTPVDSVKKMLDETAEKKRTAAVVASATPGAEKVEKAPERKAAFNRARFDLLYETAQVEYGKDNTINELGFYIQAMQFIMQLTDENPLA